MDSKWEFQAPQFVDFTNLDNEDQNADSFFDVDPEGGNTIEDNFVPADEPTGRDQEREVPVADENRPPEQESATAGRRKNMVTSWDFLKMKVVKAGASKNDTAEPTLRRSGRRSTLENTGPAAAGTTSSSSSATSSSNSGAISRPGSATLVRRPESESRRSLRQAVAQTVENYHNSPRFQNRSRSNTPNLHGRLPGGQVAKNKSSSASRRLSVAGRSGPRTPDVMKRFKNKLLNSNLATQASAEDFKVKKAEQDKKKTAEPLKAVAPSIKMPVLTKPAEFKFATDARLKAGHHARAASVGGSTGEAVDFTRMLRSYGKPSDSETVHNKGVTKPEPFPRTESNRKRRHSADTEAATNKAFKSVAEQISKFQLGTPDRFRSKPRNNAAAARIRSASPTNRLTVPKTPQLTTKLRSRPVHVLSQAEREELELEEIRKNQFKAHGVGETVPKFRPGAPLERRPATIPEPFHLTEGGTARQHPPPQPQEEKVEFHSRPLNKKIFEAPVGVPERRPLPVVAPESPAFALKQRMMNRRAAPEPELQPQPAVPPRRAAPHRGVPVCLPPLIKKSTVPSPFSFAERDQVLQARKEEKIKKVLEEERAAREFHANPIPKAIENPKLPEKKVLPPTKPEPFKLNIEERVETRVTKWQEEVAKELEEQKKATLFKASEPKVLSQAPFVPKPSDKPLVEISNITLHSERRAEERHAYDLERRRKEVDLEEARRQAVENRKKEEQAEIARLRREAVPRAQPIRAYKPIEVKPSERPLTMPASPRFSARVRSGGVNETTGSQ